MVVMGWSNTAMAARYQQIIAATRRDVATSVGGLLWNPEAAKKTVRKPMPRRIGKRGRKAA